MDHCSYLCSCLSLFCCLVCPLQPCDHLLERAEVFALVYVLFSCVFVQGQERYLIVSIPDICLPLYFVAICYILPKL